MLADKSEYFERQIFWKMNNAGLVNDGSNVCSNNDNCGL